MARSLGSILYQDDFCCYTAGTVMMNSQLRGYVSFRANEVPRASPGGWRTHSDLFLPAPVPRHAEEVRRFSELEVLLGAPPRLRHKEYLASGYNQEQPRKGSWALIRPPSRPRKSGRAVFDVLRPIRSRPSYYILLGLCH